MLKSPYPQPITLQLYTSEGQLVTKSFQPIPPCPFLTTHSYSLTKIQDPSPYSNISFATHSSYSGSDPSSSSSSSSTFQFEPQIQCSQQPGNSLLTSQVSSKCGGQFQSYQILKKIPKTKHLSKDNTLSQIYNQSLLNGNTNFVEIKEVYEDGENVYIFMEGIGQGPNGQAQSSDGVVTIGDIVRKRGPITQREVHCVFWQLANILESLRRNNIFHGFINLDNLYLNTHTFQLKLSNFSNSQSLKSQKFPHQNLFSTQLPFPEPYPTLTSTVPFAYSCLSPPPSLPRSPCPPDTSIHFVAPELLDSTATIDNVEIYYQADIWAVGAVLYSMLVGVVPFGDIKQGKESKGFGVQSKIKNYDYFIPQNLGISSVWKELIKNIFKPYKNRITLQQLLDHPLTNAFPNFSNLTAPNKNPIHYQSVHCNQPTCCSSLTKPCQLHACTLHPSISLNSAPEPSLISLMLANCCPLPPATSPPVYVQHYLYITKYKCLGYIFDDCIGVVYQGDGGYIVGRDYNDYLYCPNQNQSKSLDDLLNEYCRIYRQRSSNLHNGTEDHGGCSNLLKCRVQGKYGNVNYIDQINQNTNLVDFSFNNPKSSSPSQKSQKNASPSLNSTIHQNSSQLPQKKSKMLQVSKCQNLIKFSQSFFSSSNPFPNFSQLSNPYSSLPLNSLQLQQSAPCSQFPTPQAHLSYSSSSSAASSLSPQKLSIYQYMIKYFGERVIHKKIEEWIIAFWKIDGGFVFLYLSGNWQVNFSMASSFGHMKEGKKHKKGKQCAVIIDRYGMAWWLSQNQEKMDSLTPAPRETLRNLKYKRIDQGYNPILIHIARSVVKQIKKQYVNFFEDVMEAYKYGSQGS